MEREGMYTIICNIDACNLKTGLTFREFLIQPYFVGENPEKGNIF